MLVLSLAAGACGQIIGLEDPALATTDAAADVVDAPAPEDAMAPDDASVTSDGRQETSDASPPDGGTVADGSTDACVVVTCEARGILCGSVTSCGQSQDCGTCLAISDDAPGTRILRKTGTDDFEYAWQERNGGSITTLLWADLDDDSVLELIEAGSNTPVRVFHQGSGTLTRGWQSELAEMTTTIAVGDLDRDDILDLVVGNRTSKARIYRGLPGGAFELHWSSTAAVDSRRVSLSDIDGDRDLDVLNATGGGLIIYRNDETTFTEERLSYQPAYAILTDLDGDRDGDVFGVADDGVAVVIENQGGILIQRATHTRVTAIVRDLAAGDLDADGDVDVVMGDELGVAALWKQSNFSFTTTPIGAGCWSMDVLDYDGDSDGDVACGIEGVETKILRNDHGQLSSSFESAVSSTSYAVRWSIDSSVRSRR